MTKPHVKPIHTNPNDPMNQGPRGAKERNKKATYLPTYFFEFFRSDFRKYFNGVFGLLMQRNGQKRD